MARTKHRLKGASQEMNDLTVITAGVTLAFSTTEVWAQVMFWVPESIKFLGLVATVVYLIFRAGNEVRKYLRDNRPGDST